MGLPDRENVTLSGQMPFRDHIASSTWGFRAMLGALSLAVLSAGLTRPVSAADGERYGSPSDFERYAMKLRENALLKVEPFHHDAPPG